MISTSIAATIILHFKDIGKRDGLRDSLYSEEIGRQYLPYRATFEQLLRIDFSCKLGNVTNNSRFATGFRRNIIIGCLFQHRLFLLCDRSIVVVSFRASVDFQHFGVPLRNSDVISVVIK